MPRLFVAIDLPEKIRSELANLREELPGARWVAGDQLHLTLRFIGEVEARQQGDIDEALRHVHDEPFSLTLRQVGHFGRPGRVLWVGMDRPPTLLALQQKVEAALALTGTPPEERPFSPHITLARIIGTPAHLLSNYEEKHRGFASTTFPVTEFHLYSSTLTSTGAIHRREGSYQLTSS
ncbi:MAG: RNA 2',3'-cyclic phosphodiesterase [Geobacter sp.]|nr:MAG: RNA 2',3'-cyclic phosphodiesterase [Geobacter sp.]